MNFKGKNGFTLLELIIVLGVLAILITIMNFKFESAT